MKNIADNTTCKDLATKGDLHDVRNEILALRSDIQDLRNDLKQGIYNLDNKISKTKHELIKWFIVIFLIQGAVLIGTMILIK